MLTDADPAEQLPEVANVDVVVVVERLGDLQPLRLPARAVLVDIVHDPRGRDDLLHGGRRPSVHCQIRATRVLRN